VQIDILEDARELEYHLRMKRLERAVQPPETLIDATSKAGRESLQVEENADYFTMDFDDPSIVGGTDILFSAGRPAIRDVYVNGKQIVKAGRHAKQDEIVQRFKMVQRKLWG
jgi:formimidoylglutamate deiminase